jgi:plasmid stability protein
MAQMLVRNIDDEVAARFKARAKAEGKSAEQVLRELIDRYAARSVEERLAALDAFRETTIGKSVVDPVATIREYRDNTDSYR